MKFFKRSYISYEQLKKQLEVFEHFKNEGIEVY